MYKNSFKFIVYAPSFEEDSGGSIALHRLCDLLNKNGEEAYLYNCDSDAPIFKIKSPIRSVRKKIKWMKYKNVKPYKTNELFDTPIVTKDILDQNCVVIYSEIVSGNPLNAKNVVRWLLHKPGFLTGEINYGINDLIFFFQSNFNDPTLNPNNDNYLNVVWIRDDIYKKTNFSERNGTCYLIRKGKNKKMIHDVESSILLDGKSHNEIANIMNKCEYFISYDINTMYTAYGVLCGCKTIVVPEEGITKEQRQPRKELRSGIAYGFDDLEEAEKTKHLLYDVIKQQEKDSNGTVKLFIKKVYEYFGEIKA